MKFENEKQKEEFACNPVGKARIIANTLTNDSKLSPINPIMLNTKTRKY